MRINHDDGHLYCSIDDIKERAAYYKNAVDMYADLEQDIVDECTKKNYNEQETKTILDHYFIVINNIKQESFQVETEA